MSTDSPQLVPTCSPKHSPSWQKAPGPSEWKSTTSVEGDQLLSYTGPDFGRVDLLTNVTGEVASGFGEEKSRLWGDNPSCPPTPPSQETVSQNQCHSLSLFSFCSLWALETCTLFYYTATSLNSIWKINGLLKNRQDLDCHQETHKSKHAKSVMETESGLLEFSRVEARLYTCPASSSCTPLLGAHVERQRESLFVLEINESLVM